jgi:hypothetical protein
MTKLRQYFTGGVLGLLLGLAFLGTAATVSYFGAGSADQLGVSLATLISGEDETNNVLKTEQQFSYKAIPHADTQVKASAGFIHSISCVSDAAATAGSIILYDNTAESGTAIWTMNLGAVPYAFSAVLDIVVTTGAYVGFTTTNDVDCVVSYR